MGHHKDRLERESPLHVPLPRPARAQADSWHVLQERLGHASITTTEKYLHTLPDADDSALDALDNIRKPTVAAPPATGPAARQPAIVASLEPVPTAEPAPERPASPDLVTVIESLDPTVVRQLLAGLLQQAQPVQPPE